MDLRVRVHQTAMVRLQHVAALGFGQIAYERAPSFRKKPAQAVQKPVDLVPAAEKNAAQDESETALRMRGPVSERKRASPRTAEDYPPLNPQVHPEPFHVGNEQWRGVVRDLAVGQRTTGPALVENNDAIEMRVEESAVVRRTAGAGSAVEEDDGNAARIAAFFPIHSMPSIELQQAAHTGLDKGKQVGNCG
jgi:hypothetical protein